MLHFSAREFWSLKTTIVCIRRCEIRCKMLAARSSAPARASAIPWIPCPRVDSMLHSSTWIHLARAALHPSHSSSAIATFQSYGSPSVRAPMLLPPRRQTNGCASPSPNENCSIALHVPSARSCSCARHYCQISCERSSPVPRLKADAKNSYEANLRLVLATWSRHPRRNARQCA